MKNIPKVAFLYWGAPVVPYLRYMCFKSFLQYNPDWKVVLYVPTQLTTKQTWTTWENKEGFDGVKDYSDRLESLGVKIAPFDMESIGFSNDLSEVIKSDIIRLYLLSTVGGLWSDSDILFFRPLTHTLKQTNHQAYFCWRRGGPTQFGSDPKFHAIGFLAGAPGNKYYRMLFDGVKQNLDTTQYQSAGSTFYKTLLNDAHFDKDPNLFNFDNNMVYPTRAANHICVEPAGRFMAEVVRNPVVIGIHWYGGAISAGQYQREVTEENYHKFDNIVSWLIHRVNNNISV